MTIPPARVTRLSQVSIYQHIKLTSMMLILIGRVPKRRRKERSEIQLEGIHDIVQDMEDRLASRLAEKMVEQRKKLQRFVFNHCARDIILEWAKLDGDLD